MRRKMIGIVVAVVLAAIGTVLLASYVNSAEDRALAGEQLVDVVVVTDPVAAGTTADELAGRIELRELPVKAVAPGALDSTESLTGLVTSVDLLPGDQLVAIRWVEPAAIEDQRDRRVEIPDGFHEVSIPIEPHRALGGDVRPGDTVSFVVSFQAMDGGGDEEPETAATPDSGEEGGAVVAPDAESTSRPAATHMTLTNVMISKIQLEELPAIPAEGQEVDLAALVPTGNLLITFAADAPTIEKIVFAAENGSIWLSGETENADGAGARIQTRDTIYIDLPAALNGLS